MQLQLLVRVPLFVAPSHCCKAFLKRFRIQAIYVFLKSYQSSSLVALAIMKDINSFRVEFLQIHKEQTLRTMKKVAANYLPGASNCSSRSSRSRRRSGGVQFTWNFSLMSAAPATRRKPIRCSCCPWVSRLSILTMMPIQEHKRFSSLATRPGTTCSWSRRR